MNPLLFLAAIMASGANSQSTSPPPPMTCETGPISRTYGGTDWLIYSCEDHQSLVFVSPQGNPAFPFYFILHPKDGRYQLYGEGNGDKGASDAAGNEISRVSQKDVASLIEATKVVPAKK